MVMDGEMRRFSGKRFSLREKNDELDQRARKPSLSRPAADKRGANVVEHHHLHHDSNTETLLFLLVQRR